MSDNTSKNFERTYFLRTICMYMDLTKDILVQLFKHLIKSENITKFLTDNDTKAKLHDLFKIDTLNKTEYNLVCSTRSEPENFDIALLIRLILGLFRDEISAPQLGWHNKPQPKDESLGADLLRLRNTRNKLIGHQKSAKLDKAEYINIFDKTEAILVRILVAFDREETDNLKKKISEYNDFHFETETGKIKRYLNELAEADNETKKLQTQVEDLLKKSKEFQTFFKTTPERFVRYVKLLFDGGGTALRGVLERELRKADKSLDSLLSENKEMLLQTIQEEYYQVLFPQESSQIDHNCWDVGLLASVILLIFTKLSTDEINKIEEIQTARQQYALHAISSLDADEFLDIWTDLISSLKHLSMGIEEEKKLYIENLIVRYKKKCKEGDVDDYLDQLRRAGNPVKTLKCVYDEYMYQLSQRLRQLKERGLQFKCEHDLELKIMVLCEDEEKKRKAEDILEQTLRTSLSRRQSHDGSFLQLETDLFMTSITSNPNIKPSGITRCCIMVTFTCSTQDGVMHLLDYFSSQDFLKRICNISNELSYLYEDAFLVQGYVTLESLSSIQTTDCQNLDSEKGISLPLKCSSIEGMDHILETLQNVKTANTLNSIADKISERLEETVSIHVTTNLFEFKDVVKDAGAQGLRSKKSTRGDQALKRSSLKDSHESLDSVSKSFELLKVSNEEEEDVMENETDKPVNEMESDCQEKCGRRQRKKENRSHQTDPMLLSPLQLLARTKDEGSNTDEDLPTKGDFTFPCNPTTRLGIQDSIRVCETSPDDRLMHSLHVRPTNVTADDTYPSLDKMLRLSDSDSTDDHVWKLDRAESTLQKSVTFKRHIMPTLVSEDEDYQRRKQVDYTFPYHHPTRLGIQDGLQGGKGLHDHRLVHSLGESPKHVTFDDTYLLDKMLQRVSDSVWTFDFVLQLERAESTLRKIEVSGRKVTSEVLNDLQTDIERLFNSLQVDGSSSTSVEKQILFPSNNPLNQRPLSASDKLRCKERLKCLYQEFVTFKRHIMSDEDYQRRKQVDYAFPYQDGLQDVIGLHHTSFDHRLVHSLGVGTKNVTVEDTFSLDKMLQRLSDSDLTFDCVLQLERAESTLREIVAPGRKVTSQDLNDLQIDIERLFHPLQVDGSSSTSVEKQILFPSNNPLNQHPLSASDKLGCKERLKCLYQEFVTFKRHIMPKILSEDEDYQRRKQVDYTFPYHRPKKLGKQDGLQGVKRLHDTSFDHRLVHSLGVSTKNVTVDDTFSLDKMLQRLSESDLTFDYLLQLERAESTLREIETPGRKVTSQDLNDLQTDIERLFYSLQVDESSSTSVKKQILSLPNNPLNQRPLSASDKLGCKERLKCLYQEFVTFKRHIMPKLVSEDEDYQRKKQELKDFLITTHRKTLKEKGFNKKISMIFGRGRLMSPKTGIVTSYRGIFYDDYQRKQHKHIHIIGDEGRASTVCLELVSAWCEAQSEGNVQILKNFEFVFMISLSDVGSDDSINEMLRLHLPGDEFIGTLDQVLQLEPDKCLVILDGLDKWRQNTYSMYYSLEIPKGNLFSDYVILVTASRYLKNRIKREFGDKQLLYIC